jgi:class 3 adenylate cyclase/streptogramin lyase
MPRQRRSGLATVMFTDIVASSTIAETLGDARWRVLLGRHNDLIRRELGNHGGRELDTAGDGFFTAFDDPVGAVRCAAAIVEGVQRLGLDVRIGLHFGRIEQIGRKPGGVVVHIGARVMSLAGPAEVLITGTLRDLIPGGGFRFEDRGRHALKGISEESSIYRLMAVDRPLPGPLTADEAAARRERVEAPPFVRRRRVPLLVAATALLVAAALVVAFLPRSKPTAPPRRHTLAHALLEIDASTMRTKATIALGNPLTGVGSFAVGLPLPPERDIAVGPEGSVWVTNGDDNSVTRLDPATGTTTTIRLPEAPRSIAIGSGAVWVAVDGGPVLYRIDPATRRVDASVTLGELGFAVAVDQTTGAVWVLTVTQLERVDPSSNTVVANIAIPGLSPGGANLGAFPFTSLRMAATGGTLWVPVPNGELIRLDESTNRLVTYHLSERLAEAAVDASNGSLWVTSTHQRSVGELLRLDVATTKVEDRLGLGCCPGSVAVGAGGIWVTDQQNDTLTEISSATGAVGSPLRLGAQPTSVAVGGRFIWVVTDAPPG